MRKDGPICGWCGKATESPTSPCPDCGRTTSKFDTGKYVLNRLELPSFSDVMPEKESSQVSKKVVMAVSVGIALAAGFLFLLSRM